MNWNVEKCWRWQSGRAEVEVRERDSGREAGILERRLWAVSGCHEWRYDWETEIRLGARPVSNMAMARHFWFRALESRRSVSFTARALESARFSPSWRHSGDSDGETGGASRVPDATISVLYSTVIRSGAHPPWKPCGTRTGKRIVAIGSPVKS